MTSDVENPKDSSKALLEPLNNHGKVAGYKAVVTIPFLPAMNNQILKLKS